MRIIYPMMLTVIIAMCLIGNTLYQADVDNNETRNIYNLTESILVWNFSYTELAVQNFSDITNINIAKTQRLSNIVNKGVDFIGYTSMEIGKFFIEFGYTHPDINYKVAFTFIRYYFVLLIVSVATPLIIPGIAIICILFMGIINLIKYLKKTSQNTTNTNKEIKNG